MALYKQIRHSRRNFFIHSKNYTAKISLQLVKLRAEGLFY